MKLPPFRLERFFAPREFGAALNLCASDCEAWTVEEILELEPGSRQGLLELPLSYTEPPGSPALREAIAGLYEGLGPDDILVHSAGQEAILTFALALLAPGDHVIVHQPSYQSLLELPRALGCDVTPWPAEPQNGWALDLDRLRDAIRPDTRAVIVNLPHSPTGYHMDRASWTEFLGIAAEHDLIVFSDEAYRGLEVDAEGRLPAAAECYDRAISLGLLSKGFGLPGLRIGWLASARADVLSAVAQVKDYTTICSSAPSEYLATVALRHHGTILDRARLLVRENLGLLREFLAAHQDSFSWVPPVAGPVAFPAWRGGDVERFCESVLREAELLLLPGTVFADAGNRFRVGFGRRNFSEGLSRLADYLSREAPQSR